MPYSFTPNERVTIQIALEDLMISLEDRLKSYEAKKRPSIHTRTLIENAKSALDKVNGSSPLEV